MKQRVITAIFLGAGFIALFFFLPAILTRAAFGVFAAIGVWELLVKTKSMSPHVFVYISCVAAFAVVFFSGSMEDNVQPLFITTFVYMVCAFACAVFDHENVGFSSIAKGFMGAIVMPFMLGAIPRILGGGAGRYLIMAPWVTVWVCDSAALFVGKALGKHKLAPYVSPKKTVEGFVGGLAGGVLAMAAYVLVLGKFFDFALPMLPMLCYGLAGSALGQLGDLSLSVLKRESGIKDYGNIFPGHGGIWDRFDSVLFAAPLFEVALLFALKI